MAEQAPLKNRVEGSIPSEGTFRLLGFGVDRGRGSKGMTAVATFDDFEKIDIRVGIVLEAMPFPEGKHSTHILMIDFGPDLGTKKSLAKLAPNYAAHELMGRQVLCVVNFPPRQIGKHLSEVLTLGNVVLLRPDQDVPLGGRLF